MTTPEMLAEEADEEYEATVCAIDEAIDLLRRARAALQSDPYATNDAYVYMERAIEALGGMS
jgi:hypothetical protein